ncbi:MAG: metal-dependent hydrolase [Candidatus Acidiferrum sp.]
MDIVTHGLASLAIARGFFPRAGKAAMAGSVLAGTIANVDWLSYCFGPSAYLAWHHTYLHSILAALLIPAILSAIPLKAIVPKHMPAPGDVSAGQNLRGRLFPTAFLLLFCAALLHIAMDACQSTGVTLFWPFSSTRFAADWLPRIDPWILTILILTIAFPELLRLVSSEIGAKDKGPRGQTGAIVGLVLIFVYVGARGVLHSNVLAMMNARTFHGETPRRVSAFPGALSLLTWHGVAETETALNEIEVDATAGSTFDPDTSLRLFKPEDSAALDAARDTATARRFLVAARIPKASVEKNETGYVVILRDLSYAARGDTGREVAAVIELDPNKRVTSEELVWARELRR